MGTQIITILGDDFDAESINRFGGMENAVSNRDDLYTTWAYDPPRWNIEANHTLGFHIYYGNGGYTKVEVSEPVDAFLVKRFESHKHTRMPFFGTEDAVDDLRMAVELMMAEHADELNVVYERLEYRLKEAHAKGRADWIAARAKIQVIRLEVPEGVTVIPFSPYETSRRESFDEFERELEADFKRDVVATDLD